MDKHVTMLGALLIGFGIVALVIGASLFFVIAGAGAISGDDEAMFITGMIGTILATISAFVGLPAILGGIGMMKRWNWARYLVLIVAALNILNFPFGTLLAVYTFWVFSQDEVVDVFRKRLPGDPPPSSPPSTMNGDDEIYAT